MKRGLWSLLWLVVWLGAAESLLRWPRLQAELQPYQPADQWYSLYIPRKIALLEQQPSASVWFVGSSAVLYGLDPARITAGTSVNLGALGLLRVEQMRAYVEAAFWPVAQPKTLVVGIIPDRFGWTMPEPYRSQEAQLRVRVQEWDYQLGAWLGERSALYRYSRAWAGFFTQVPPPQQPTGVLETGYEPLFTHLTADTPKPRRVTTVEEYDYLETSLAQLADWHQALAAQGIALRMVNLPCHPAFIAVAPGGAVAYQAYQARLAAFSAAQNLPYLDVQAQFAAVQPPATWDALFGDFAHLNDDGAAAIAPFLTNFLSTNTA